MATDKSHLAELLKYPLTVFSLLVALIIAKTTLGITFGQVEEVGKGRIKFAASETRKTKEGSGKSQEVAVIQTGLLKFASASGRGVSAPIRRAVGSMSRDTLFYVLSNDAGQIISDSLPEHPDKTTYNGLVTAGLCVQLSTKELKVEEAKQKKEADGLKTVAFGIRCGEMYEKTRTFLTEFVSEIVDQLRTEVRSEHGGR